MGVTELNEVFLLLKNRLQELEVNTRKDTSGELKGMRVEMLKLRKEVGELRVENEELRRELRGVKRELGRIS